MTEQEYLIMLSKDFDGKDREHLQHVAMYGTKPEIQGAIYQAEEMISGRRRKFDAHK